MFQPISGTIISCTGVTLDSLRFLPRLFWDRSSAIRITTWRAKYCIQFLAVHVCICYISQLRSNFHKRRYYGWQNSRWGDRWWNSVQKILKICQKSIRLIPYISMHFHCNGVICLGTHSAHICWVHSCSQTHLDKNGSEVQMAKNTKFIIRWCINSLEAKM